jgi:glycosyltransferase A (GT-A) superfamily protein (DUF2064 family)
MRLKFFADSDMDVTVPLQDRITQQDNKGDEFIPEQILEYEFDKQDKEHYFKIQWTGFSELENTWEPVSVIYEDCPDLVESFLETCERTIRDKIRNVLGIRMA